MEAICYENVGWIKLVITGSQKVCEFNSLLKKLTVVDGS